MSDLGSRYSETWCKGTWRENWSTYPDGLDHEEVLYPIQAAY